MKLTDREMTFIFIDSATTKEDMQNIRDKNQGKP